jgi:hypothetical protein
MHAHSLTVVVHVASEKGCHADVNVDNQYIAIFTLWTLTTPVPENSGMPDTIAPAQNVLQCPVTTVSPKLCACC